MPDRDPDQLYVLLEDGTLAEGPCPLPATWRTISGLGALDDDELAQVGRLVPPIIVTEHARPSVGEAVVLEPLGDGTFAQRTVQVTGEDEVVVDHEPDHDNAPAFAWLPADVTEVDVADEDELGEPELGRVVKGRAKVTVYRHAEAEPTEPPIVAAARAYRDELAATGDPSSATTARLLGAIADLHAPPS